MLLRTQPAGVDEAQAPDAVANEELLDVWLRGRTRETPPVEGQHRLYALGEGRPELDDHPASGPGRIECRRRVLGDHRRAGGQRQHHQTGQDDIPPSSDGLLACAPRHNRLHVTSPLRSDRCSSHVKPHPNGSKGGPGRVGVWLALSIPSARPVDESHGEGRDRLGEFRQPRHSRRDHVAPPGLGARRRSRSRSTGGPRLRGPAAAGRARLRRGGVPTLNPSDLVHEAVIRLIGQTAHFESRAHFFGVAAVMIRRVLVDHARARRARKRGGTAVRVDLSKANAAVAPGTSTWWRSTRRSRSWRHSTWSRPGSSSCATSEDSPSTRSRKRPASRSPRPSGPGPRRDCGYFGGSDARLAKDGQGFAQAGQDGLDVLFGHRADAEAEPAVVVRASRRPGRARPPCPRRRAGIGGRRSFVRSSWPAGRAAAEGMDARGQVDRAHRAAMLSTAKPVRAQRLQAARAGGPGAPARPCDEARVVGADRRRDRRAAPRSRPAPPAAPRRRRGRGWRTCAR